MDARRFPIAEPWKSHDPQTWAEALNHYWDLVQPRNRELEEALNALDLDRLPRMDAPRWDAFLRDEYFCWKYTAPNRFESTTKPLRKFTETRGVEALDQHRKRLLALDPADIASALEAADHIPASAGREAMKRVAIYTRVSTDAQTTENQRRELEKVLKQRGWKLVEVYTDHGISGAKGRDQRPAFDRLIKDATRGRFDMIAAWSVDRLGRSLRDLLGFLTEIHALGVGLYLHQQAVDTTTPAGRALFQMMGVFAEFERAMIRERVMAGLARARAKRVRLGRPKLATEIEERVRAELTKGTGILKTGRLVGVGTGSVQRIKREMRQCV